MKSTNKRAFIMENCNSPYIAQAIFILKDGIDSDSTKVITDAEKIVASYMGRSGALYNKKEKKHTGQIIALCVSMTITALLIFLKLYSLTA